MNSTSQRLNRSRTHLGDQLGHLIPIEGIARVICTDVLHLCLTLQHRDLWLSGSGPTRHAAEGGRGAGLFESYNPGTNWQAYTSITGDSKALEQMLVSSKHSQSLAAVTKGTGKAGGKPAESTVAYSRATLYTRRT